MATARKRIPKTSKMYVNGKFIRSEQGRVLKQLDAKGNMVSNYPRANRKDLRDALVAARAAQSGWAARTAFNRSLILYRMAEMLEDRTSHFVNRLTSLEGMKAAKAKDLVGQAVDRLMHYGGWADKYPQITSSVNPVAAPFFNFTHPQPVGIVGVITPSTDPLVGLVESVAPVLVSGNAVVCISEHHPMLTLDFAEVVATSDVPAGALNLLSGEASELLPHLSGHKDVNAISAHGLSTEDREMLERMAADNMKRVTCYSEEDLARPGLYRILPFVEFKTAWHPVSS